jgi:hypothetical protein
VKNYVFRKQLSKKGLRTPPYLQGKLTFYLDDYGKKEFITTQISGPEPVEGSAGLKG